MAADSLSQMSSADGEVRSLHQSVEKITEIRGRPIALMVNGLGEIKKRTIVSLIREFEFRQYALNPPAIRHWTVSEMTEHLSLFLQERYVAAASTQSTSQKPLGIVVGGYSPGAFFPEVFELTFPGRLIKRVFPNPPTESFGSGLVEFWGQRKALERLLFGYERDAIAKAVSMERAIDALRQAAPGSQDAATFASLPEEYRNLPPPPTDLTGDLLKVARLIRMEARLEGMPLQEAVEFAEYLGNVTIGFDRFAIGTPAVGGELDVLAIQPEGLHWYRRKKFLRKMASARDRALELEDREEYRATMMAGQSDNIDGDIAVNDEGDDDAPPT